MTEDFHLGGPLAADEPGASYIADSADRIAYVAEHCPDYVQAVQPEQAQEAS